MDKDAPLLKIQASLDASTERLNAMSANSDLFFLIVNAMIVYFIGAIAYWVFGYAFAFGAGNFFIGYDNFVSYNLESEKTAFWFFQFTFAATAATIVSGALAERCDFAAYLIYSVVITGFVYPVVTHWAWTTEGWLAQGISFDMDNSTATVVYQDFAGSGVVHLLGGMSALVGAAILGKRLDRYDDEGNLTDIPGHSVPLAALGGFILFFGFFAFNGGSQLSISSVGDGEAVAIAVVNTIISGAFAAIFSMVAHRLACYVKGSNAKWSLLVTVNGGISGMVAICAACNTVYPYGAAVIGAVAGVNYLVWSFTVKKIGVDDPLDAVAVHAGSGIWGVLAAPILSRETGIAYAWNKRSLMGLAWNMVGVVAIGGWALGTCLVLFGSLRLFKIFRVNPEHERRGLDIPKHGEPAYPTRSYGDGWNSRPLEADTYSLPPKPDAHADNNLPYTITNNGFVDDEISATKM